VRFGYEDYLNRNGRNIGSPRLTLLLEKGGAIVPVKAVLDSGAEVSLFDRTVADDLGITVEDGFPVPISGIGGQEKAYAHLLTMTVTDGTETVTFPCRALFKENVHRNLIGREDFFEMFRITLAWNERYIHLDPVLDPEELG
jgi:hypothetical protein